MQQLRREFHNFANYSIFYFLYRTLNSIIIKNNLYIQIQYVIYKFKYKFYNLSLSSEINLK
jgi:hypothetical protein